MAKVYISYSHKDSDVAATLARRLGEAGHLILIDTNELTAGTNWRDTLLKALRSADIFVVVISKDSLESSHVMSEIGMARAYIAEYGKALFVPVLLDDIPIPPAIQDILALRADRNNLAEAANRILQAITLFIGRLEANLQKSAEQATKIQQNSADYIKSASDKQKKLESEHKIAGWIWYIIGFLSLSLAVAFSAVALLNTSDASPFSFGLVIHAVGSIVVVGLLGACAKYAFSLGKSFTSESLKNSDRIHAISFGEFYLRACGDKFEWSEVKDAFQHWNIDRSSTFSSLSAADFDPRIIEILADIVKTAAGKSPKEGG